MHVETAFLEAYDVRGQHFYEKKKPKDSIIGPYRTVRTLAAGYIILTTCSPSADTMMPLHGGHLSCVLHEQFTINVVSGEDAPCVRADAPCAVVLFRDGEPIGGTAQVLALVELEG